MSLLLLYLLMLLAVFLLQRKLMYFPSRFSEKQHQAMLARLDLQPWPSPDESRGLIGKMPISGGKGTVLVFHGNAGSAVHRTYFVDALRKLGYRVIVAEYPGYGTRGGMPSETSLIGDGVATAKMVARTFNGPLFLCGESLGCGVVAGVVAAHEVPVQGLLLIAPFDSMAKVAQHHYWFFLARWLLLDRYDNVPKLRPFQGPVATVLAEQDEIIPNRNSMALYDALSAPKKLWRFSDAGHNSLPMEAWQAWWREAMAFLDGQA